MTAHAQPAMRILTVRQPWAWAIIAGHKPVENRSWTTDYRGPLAIHAGRTPAPEGWRELDQLGMPHPPFRAVEHGCIIGVVTLTGHTTSHPSPWAHEGAWHWTLSRPRACDPLAWRGQVGLTVAPAWAAQHVAETAREVGYVGGDHDVHPPPAGVIDPNHPIAAGGEPIL